MKKITIVTLFFLMVTTSVFARKKTKLVTVAPYFNIGVDFVKMMYLSSLNSGPNVKLFTGVSTNFINSLKSVRIFSSLKKEFPVFINALETHDFDKCKKVLLFPETVEGFYKRTYQFMTVMGIASGADFFSFGVQIMNLRVNIKINKNNMIKESTKGVKIVIKRLQQEKPAIMETSEIKKIESFINAKSIKDLSKLDKALQKTITHFSLPNAKK